jgi:hypothetical protein
LLDVLARHGVNATFCALGVLGLLCVLGVHAQAQPELIRERAPRSTRSPHAQWITPVRTNNYLKATFGASSRQPATSSPS